MLCREYGVLDLSCASQVKMYILGYCLRFRTGDALYLIAEYIYIPIKCVLFLNEVIVFESVFRNRKIRIEKSNLASFKVVVDGIRNRY